MENKKLLGYNNVLCLSPHPDDVEYSMSGTINKFKDTQFYIYCMTKGTKDDNSTGCWRFDEVSNFWVKTNLKNVILLFNNDFFGEISEGEWISKIESTMKDIRIDAIFAPSDNDSHYEHLITNRIMNALGRSKPIDLIEYRSPSTLDTWTPNLFIDDNKYFNVKTKLLFNNFISQRDSKYFSDESIEIFHKTFNTNKKGLYSCEQFKIKTKFY